MGWEVHVITNGDAKVPFVDKEYSVPIERDPFKTNNLKAYFNIVDIMKRERYSLVTCHTPMGGFLGRLAVFASRTSPIIYTAHGFHFFQGAGFMNIFVYKNMERLMARFTDALVTINTEDYKAAHRFTLKKGGKVYLIHGIGVDIKKIEETKITREKKRQEMGININATVFLNIAELIKRKNQSTIIKAFAKLDNKDAMLIICGSGELELELKKLASELGVGNRVMFLGFRTDINEILKMADVFVFSSLHEGLAVALMEAMAAELPVICSNVRGCRDLIKDGDGGYLLAAEDTDGFSMAMEKLAGDLELRKKFGFNNKMQVEKYSIQNAVNDMKKIYDDVLKGEMQYK